MKSVIRLTKIFRFEAAHVLSGYDGPCRNIHGHSYVLEVTIKGIPISEPNHPKCGMVMDFSQLKKMIHELIIDPFDHGLMVHAASEDANIFRSAEFPGKTILLPYQPTCENMVADFAEKISQALPDGISLHMLRLHETSSSYADWVAEDNA